MTEMIVDSHCHLDYEGIADRLPKVLSAARTAGVGQMLSISTRVAKFPQLLDLAEQNEGVYCTVGTHPHNAHEELDVTAGRLVDLARHPKVIGVGEAGLDYHYDFSPREAQERGFRTHIAAARESGLPLIIHAREADEHIARILTEEMAAGRFSMVMHCFSSGAALADASIELGAYVSFSGILTYKSADNLRAIAASVPVEKLLVETDAPYLAPVPYRGKTNEPAFVVETLKTLAAVRGLEPEVMARQTTENFFRLFSKAIRPA